MKSGAHLLCSVLMGLLNAQTAMALEDNCSWVTRTGGFFQVQPATEAGNYACYPPHTSAEEMKASCCAAGLKQCVSVA
eukprot:COSAG03_NODE_14191_length_473_cov_0.949198_1_plen_77_part_10